PGGYLLLGTSETADAATNLFSIVDRQHRIYRSKLGRRSARSLPVFPLGGLDHVAPTLKAGGAERRRVTGVAELHQQLLLEEYAPASVVINQDGEIVHSSAGAGRFLRFREGDPSHQLLGTVEPSLRPALRAALFQASESKAGVTTPTIQQGQGDRMFNVHMAVSPVDRTDWPPNLTLVVFIETPASERADAMTIAAGEKDAVVTHLEGQLHYKEEQLQTTIERYETSCEELKATNEELQSVNEEMRSATEELETGKEELQSANEELITVNHELRLKIDETAQVNDDLQNLISSTEIATVFVDPEMRIKRFTPAAASIFNIIESDAGRSLLDITHKLDYPGLAGDAAETFASLRMVEREVKSSDGCWFLARVLPYRTGENRISGAVLTFVDITTRVRAESLMHLGEEHMQLVAASMPDFAILTLDLDGKMTSWSSGAERMFGYSEQEAIGQSIEIIFTPEDRARGMPAEEMRNARERGKAPDERWHLRKDGSRFFVSGIMAPLTSGDLKGYAKIARDVTADRESANASEAAKALAEASLKMKDDFLAVMSHELKHPLNLIQVNAQLLLSLPETSRIAAARKAGETIERCVAAQSRIIDDLLDLSRTQSGKLHLDLAPLELRQAIEPTMTWAAEKTKDKKIDFRYTGSE
ncbi:MAG: PAS domain-containing protein, partial [Caldimonas sp.]